MEKNENEEFIPESSEQPIGLTDKPSDELNESTYSEEPILIKPQPEVSIQTQPIEPKLTKEKKRHPLAYALGVGALALGCGFTGTYLGNQIAPKRSVIYQTLDSSSPINATGTGLSIQEIAANNLNSVVEIQTEDVTGFLNQTYVQQGAGSGVIFTQDGYIITNNHVINNASSIKVKLHNGESYEATVIGKDTKTDLAVLKIETTNLTPVVLGNSENIAIGDIAVAIGNPLGQLGGSVTDGIISALNRSITLSNQTMNLLQTNAQVSPGNSGGGLFNANGELIGIVVAKSNAADTEGIGFAIPINDVKEVVEELINHGFVTNRPTLGVYLQEVPSNSQGVKPGLYIQEVIENSAAESAGLQANDRIIAIGDVEVTNYSELSAEVAKYSVNDTVSIQVVRDGKTMTIDCTLGQSTQS